MIYQFGPYELDLATFELRADGKTCNLEPQVFALIALLVENHDRLVSKEEIIEKVWDGREPKKVGCTSIWQCA
jgi:DNA-binding winged helix-turn-helix (wHTH) protein